MPVDMSTLLKGRLPLVYAILSALLFGSCAPVTRFFIGSSGPVMLASLFYLGSGTGMFILIIAGWILRGGSPVVKPR